MIDWVGAAFVGLWVFGLSLVAAALSFTYSTAQREKQPYLKLLDGTRVRLATGCGMVLFSLGAAGSAADPWQRVVWGILTVLLTVQVCASIRSSGRRKKDKPLE